MNTKTSETLFDTITTLYELNKNFFHDVKVGEKDDIQIKTLKKLLKEFKGNKADLTKKHLNLTLINLRYKNFHLINLL